MTKDELEAALAKEDADYQNIPRLSAGANAFYERMSEAAMAVREHTMHGYVAEVILNAEAGRALFGLLPGQTVRLMTPAGVLTVRCDS